MFASSCERDPNPDVILASPLRFKTEGSGLPRCCLDLLVVVVTSVVTPNERDFDLNRHH